MLALAAAGALGLALPCRQAKGDEPEELSEYGYDPDVPEPGTVEAPGRAAKLPPAASVRAEWLPPVGRQSMPNCFVWASVYGLATFYAARKSQTPPTSPDRQAGPDNRVLPEESVLGRGQQRGATPAAVQPVGPLADLAEQRLERHAASDRPAVAAVGRDDPVRGFQGGAGPDRNRFLPQAQMDRALDDTGVAELEASFLEPPDDAHAAIEVKHVRIVRHYNNRSRLSLVCARA